MAEDITTLINIMAALPNPEKTLAFGSDHAGFALKEYLKTQCQNWGYNVIDCGTYSEESVDYPDFVPPVVTKVLAGAYGVLICGSGIGMSIAANRHKGIRAALCADPLWAKLAREHNDANIIALGERLLGQQEALECLRTFLTTPFDGGRHLRRVQKLDL